MSRSRNRINNTLFVTKMQGFTLTYKPKILPKTPITPPTPELKSTKQAKFTEAEKLVIASLTTALNLDTDDQIPWLTEEKGHREDTVQSCFSKMNALLDTLFSRPVVNLLLTSVNNPVLFKQYYSSLTRESQALWDKLTQSECPIVTHFNSQYQKLYGEFPSSAPFRELNLFN